MLFLMLQKDTLLGHMVQLCCCCYGGTVSNELEVGNVKLRDLNYWNFYYLDGTHLPFFSILCLTQACILNTTDYEDLGLQSKSLVLWQLAF